MTVTCEGCDEGHIVHAEYTYALTLTLSTSSLGPTWIWMAIYFLWGFNGFFVWF
jgi:hypothetical protein